jgi:secretion/DNA translocation related TadE-like protein
VSGSVLTVGIAAGLIAITGTALPAHAALAARQAVAGAADAAALAAADVAVGRVPGVPCELAADVAAANGATLSSCAADGLVVTVTASRGLLGILVTASATAGPPS